MSRDADQGEDVQGRSRDADDYHDLRDKRLLVRSRNNVLSRYSLALSLYMHEDHVSAINRPLNR